MTRVLVSDKIAAEGVEHLRSQGGLDVVFEPEADRARVLELVRDAQALIVRSRTRVDAELIDAAPALRIIGRAGIGIDNIDLARATERGIIVVNTPDANATTTAELALAHLFSLCRNLPAADASLRQGKWERSRLMGAEISGKVLGVIGFGTIGRIVADRARGLKLRVLGADPFVPREVFEGLGVEAVELDALLESSDFVTLHCPLTDKTRGLIGAAELARMKPGARLINCARGGLVDEAALAESLREGHLAGAAVDVYEKEPPEGSPLLDAPNVCLTPHLGASTREAQLAVGLAIARQVATYLRTGEAAGALNVPVVSAEDLATVQPFMELARCLGRLLAALADSPLRELEIALQGRAAKVDMRPISLAAQAGLLSLMLDVPVNEVNAPCFLERQGIRLTESRSVSAEDYVATVTLRGRGESGELSVTGTLLGEKHPRVVRIDDFEIEAEPRGTLLLTRHEDLPGVIGSLGTLLGGRGINISWMQVGLSPCRTEAIAVLGISETLPPDLLKSVAGIPAIHRVDQVKL